MAVKFTDYFNVNHDLFVPTGAFDPILDIDSRYFLNIVLLRTTENKYFQNSNALVNERFSSIFKLLSKNQTKGDLFWRSAEKIFLFPEVSELCLGYSGESTSGSGIGPGLRERILETAKLIIDTGRNDPDLFKLMGLFEEDIGPDRISDMIAGIIKADIIEYSKYVMSCITISEEHIKSKNGFVINPFSQREVLFIPSSLLHELPIATTWKDISAVCFYNSELRNVINENIGAIWKDATLTERKESFKKYAIKHPEVLDQLVAAFSKLNVKEYDFINDPKGEYIWYDASKEYTAKHPLVIERPEQYTTDSVFGIARKICLYFKGIIENNGLNSLLYYKDEPRHEGVSQLLFFAIAKSFCETNDIDISPEADAGRGPVDFKFSKGFINKVLVEVKLTRNKNLVKGYEKQLAEYIKAEKATRAIYLVIDNGGPEERVESLEKVVDKHKKTDRQSPDLILVDGLIRPSASKMK